MAVAVGSEVAVEVVTAVGKTSAAEATPEVGEGGIVGVGSGLARVGVGDGSRGVGVGGTSTVGLTISVGVGVRKRATSRVGVGRAEESFADSVLQATRFKARIGQSKSKRNNRFLIIPSLSVLGFC